MKLQPDKVDMRSVSGYGPGWVAIDGQRHDSSVVVASSGTVFDWSCASFDLLSTGHFDRIAQLDLEVLLFGSGSTLRFPRGEWLGALARKGIGIETMDTAAACRTYNILAAEGRKVVAALLIEARNDSHLAIVNSR